MLSSMGYPHWMMIGGGVLVVLGFIGLAFHQNRNADPLGVAPGGTTARTDVITRQNIRPG